jgi:energy-coupling factor transporter ATP-binding protein EcfA2
MNLSVSPASLRASIDWPATPSYRPPLHVEVALSKARNILWEGEAEDKAAALAGLEQNPARALIGAALHTVEGDLAKLAMPATRVVFIGNVGVGKTTSLCYLANLTRTEADARLHRERRMKPVLSSLNRTIEEIEGVTDRPLTAREQIKLAKARSKLEADSKQLAEPVGPTDADRILLPASAGRTTVCPMEISYAVEPSIEITPLPLTTFVSLVRDAATEAFNLQRSDDTSTETSVAKEIVRAMRNMAGLNRREFEELARTASDPGALLRDLLMRIDYPSRTTTFCQPAADENPEDWLSETIADINYCRNRSLPFASSIHIRWPAAPQAIHFVDTRGMMASSALSCARKSRTRQTSWCSVQASRARPTELRSMPCDTQTGPPATTASPFWR